MYTSYVWHKHTHTHTRAFNVLMKKQKWEKETKLWPQNVVCTVIRRVINRQQRDATLKTSNGRMDRAWHRAEHEFQLHNFSFCTRRRTTRERKHFVNEINERIIFCVRSLSTDRPSEWDSWIPCKTQNPRFSYFIIMFRVKWILLKRSPWFARCWRPVFRVATHYHHLLLNWISFPNRSGH